ncbi:hypothetical protein C8J57DRAFT_1575942 [Mycena rebaudengoi]|nr:hypothetical protein C8J57DRAFT_1575942 [Mycena rebaudengoi]
MAENSIHAIYALESVLGLDAVECFIAHLIQTHFGIAIQVLQSKASSLIMEPVIDWDACDMTIYQTYDAFLLLPRPEQLLVLEVVTDLVDYARKNIDFSISSPMNWRFNNLLWNYCAMLLKTPGLSDALAIAEDAIRYNLSRTTPETDEVDWLGIQALILVDIGRFAEAETVLHDAAERWNNPDPHWLLNVIESVILWQTGRVNQTLLLLENSTSSIAEDASAITAQRPHWFLYFLFSDLSSTQLDIGQTPHALETAEKAVIKCRELHISHPHNFQPRLAVAHALSTLSDCLAAVGRTDEGLRAAQEAAVIHAKLSLWHGTCPVKYWPQEFSSKAFHTLSLRLAAVGQPNDALVNAKKAVEDYRELVFLAIRHTPSLATSLQNLASRLWDVNRRDESIKALEEAISLLRGVADQLPHHFPTLADTLEQLGAYLSMEGDAAGASAAASECFDIRERFAHSAVSAEGESEADGDSEFWDAEEGSGSTCEEILSHDAAGAIAAHTGSECEVRRGEIPPFEAEEILLSPSAGKAAGVPSMPEPEASSPAQEGGTIKEQAEEIHVDKVSNVGTRFEMKIELKSSPLDVVWWILLAILGGLALTLGMIFISINWYLGHDFFFL